MVDLSLNPVFRGGLEVIIECLGYLEVFRGVYRVFRGAYRVFRGAYRVFKGGYRVFKGGYRVFKGGGTDIQMVDLSLYPVFRGGYRGVIDRLGYLEVSIGCLKVL